MARATSVPAVVSPAVVSPAELLDPERAAGPVELTVTSRSDGTSRRVRLEAPMTVVGRGEGCGLTLADAEVSHRHASFQVLGGGLLCTDLSSRTGVHWPDGRRCSGWVAPDEPVTIGPFRIEVSGVSPPAALPPSPTLFAKRPPAALLGHRFGLEVADAGGRRHHVDLERPITLVGRDDRCKLRLKDESVSKVHASLVIAGSGVWLYDLLGRGGVAVNGCLVPWAKLRPGDELRIGRYRMRLAAEPTESGIEGPSDRNSPAAPVSDAPAAGREAALVAMAGLFAAMQRETQDQSLRQMEIMADLARSMQETLAGQFRSEIDRLTRVTEEIRRTQQELLCRPAPPPAAVPVFLPAPPGYGLVTGPEPHVPPPVAAPVGAADAAEHLRITERLLELDRERGGMWKRLTSFGRTSEPET